MTNSLKYLLITISILSAGTSFAAKEGWFSGDNKANSDASQISEYGLSSEDINYRLVTMQRHLNLSDKQFASLRATFDRYDEKYSELTAEKQKYEATLEQMLQSGNLDKNALNEVAHKLGDATARIAILRVTNRAEMYNALNEIQRVKFREYWQNSKNQNKPAKGQGSNW